jgi:cation diffusion facilitator family transporter
MPHSQGIRILIIGLILSTVLLGGKFLAYYLTQSNAILSDALESIVNVITGAFAIYSLTLARKPKDMDHPYGHGKIEFISAGIEGTLIMVAGLSIVGKSIYNLFYPQLIQSLDAGILISAFTMVAHFIMGEIIARKGKKMGSITLMANGRHLKSDAYTSLGLIVGLGVVYLTEMLWLDSLIALLFGLLIIVTGYQILKKSIGGIMDEADFGELETIIQLTNAHRRPAWIDIHNVRVIRFGQTLHIDCHLTVPWYFQVEEAHQEVKFLEDLVNNDHTQEIEFFVHIDPCIPQCCTLCLKSDCPVRQHPFQKKVEWTMENLLSNEKHRVP